MAAHRNIWLPDSIIFLVRFSLFPRDFFLRSTISLNPIRDLAAWNHVSQAEGYENGEGSSVMCLRLLCSDYKTQQQMHWEKHHIDY